jgi:hypothetical protein
VNDNPIAFEGVKFVIRLVGESEASAIADKSGMRS